MLTKLFTKKTFLLPMIFTGAVISSFPSQAISLSTYRIYLGPDQRSASFIVYNKTPDGEQCSISLVHNNFDENGIMTPVARDVLPENSAKPWVRFSPKNFTVEGLEPQSIRFTLRRKANSEPAEYRSYLRIDCDKIEKENASSKSGTNTAKLTIQPKLIQQIPIIARTGKLNATLEFTKMKVIAGALHIDLVRQGNRSVYGKIELINKKTDEVITFKKNISLYTETTNKQVKLATADIPIDQLLVRFTENASYGGDIVVERSVL
ncbi:MAG: hypothetical protein QNK36_18805 [Colwellia sp.]|nr:hypothetical protein [Colwellia sp.]